MSRQLSIQTLREILNTAGVTGLSDDDLNRITKGAASAIHAVEQTDHFQAFDSSAPHFYTVMEQLAPHKSDHD